MEAVRASTHTTYPEDHKGPLDLGLAAVEAARVEVEEAEEAEVFLHVGR